MLRGVGGEIANFFEFDGGSRATLDKEKLNYRLNLGRLDKRANCLVI